MSSGISLSPKCIESHAGLNSRKFRVLVLKITPDMTEVVLEATYPCGDGDVEAEWKEVLAALPERDCRFLVCDFQMKETPTVTKSKVIFIGWSPEDSPVRSKMIYASSREAVVDKMPVQRSLQATEFEELEYTCLKNLVFPK